jgi:hypothetical protein
MDTENFILKELYFFFTDGQCIVKYLYVESETQYHINILNESDPGMQFFHKTVSEYEKRNEIPFTESYTIFKDNQFSTYHKWANILVEDELTTHRKTWNELTKIDMIMKTYIV